VPVRQVLRTDPYEIVKSGARVTASRRITGRDLLVVAQIAICAVLVTSSLVAVRGLVRSMHSDFGFNPRNAMLVETILGMAGYRGDAVPPMQKRMIEAVDSIPSVSAVGLVGWPPLSNGTVNSSYVFSQEATDLRPANATTVAAAYAISPDYFRAAGTTILSGRSFTWHDDEQAPRVAIINQEFARKLFGSATGALGRRYKSRDGLLVQVVGIAEDGKYQSLTESPKPAVFIPLLQSPSAETWMVARFDGDPQQMAAAIRGRLRELDKGLPVFVRTWTEVMDFPLFPSRVAAVSLGILGLMGAMLSITGIFGLAAYSVSRRLRELGIRIALGAQRKEVLQAALGRALKLLAFGSAAGLFLGILATKILAFIVYQATPRDPLVLAGVVLAMALLGLLATWVPAQRALSIDPSILLREE
jgi:predicted permease